MIRFSTAVAIGVAATLTAGAALGEGGVPRARERTPHGVVGVVIKARPPRPVAAVNVVPQPFTRGLGDDAPSHLERIAVVIGGAPF